MSDGRKNHSLSVSIFTYHHSIILMIYATTLKVATRKIMYGFLGILNVSAPQTLSPYKARRRRSFINA